MKKKRANQLERAVKIHQDYFVTIEDVPEKLYLVVENPENFKIFVNDNEILKVEEGYVIDKNFRKISIEKYLKEKNITYTVKSIQGKKDEDKLIIPKVIKVSETDNGLELLTTKFSDSLK